MNIPEDAAANLIADGGTSHDLPEPWIEWGAQIPIYVRGTG
jgi:hypothetical protein